MADYTILQPVHLGSGPLGEARREALERWASEKNCFWNDEPSIGRLLKKLADERVEMRVKEIAEVLLASNDGMVELENWTNVLSDDEVNFFWMYASTHNIPRQTDKDGARLIPRSEIEKIANAAR